MTEYTDHWWHVDNPACRNDEPHNGHPFIDDQSDENWCMGLCSCYAS